MLGLNKKHLFIPKYNNKFSGNLRRYYPETQSVGATNAATQAASQIPNAALQAANAGVAAITAPENHQDS